MFPDECLIYGTCVCSTKQKSIMKKNSIFYYSLVSFLILSVTLFTSCEEDQKMVMPEMPEVAGAIEVPNASVSDGIFIIINRKSGKALDVSNFGLQNGANIIQYTSTSSDNQKWLLTRNAAGYYSIVSLMSGKGLDVSQAGTANGDNVLQWHYWGGANQQWQFVDLGNAYYRIMNRNSGKALDVAGQSTANGANIDQWSYWGGQNQQWSLTQLATGSGNGQLSWTMTSSGVPQDASDRITVAMNAAVMRYNAGADWPSRTLTVEYNTGVPTADATLSGHIRYGSSTGYQNQRTALHEIAHTWGVGTSSGWSANIQNGVFTGANADALIKSYDGSNAVINTGGGHFWPYGLNFNNEMSETAAQRHVQIVDAMVADGIYP